MGERDISGRRAHREAFAFENEEFVENAASASIVGVRAVGRLQAETVRFVTDRLSKDLEMPARLACCQSLGTMLDQQWNFAATMMKDYSDEALRMVDLLTPSARATGWSKPTSTP